MSRESVYVRYDDRTGLLPGRAADPFSVFEMVFDLMFSLNATEDQLDFPVIYGSAKNNWMGAACT